MNTPSDTSQETRRVHVIACGVLSLDLNAVIRRLKIDATVTFLPGGLHNSPRDLHLRLQEAIDEASQDSRCDLIAIGYGVCGRGAVGIQARSVPLAIPLVQDCIALFLGSDKAYREQFAANPGTYYVSAGWVEEKVRPWSAQGEEPAEHRNPTEHDANQLATRYGHDNAEAIQFFLTSWQRNYSRAVFIDTGEEPASKDRYASLAKSMAEEFGWKYEQLPGTHNLLEKLLTARHSDDEILVVPPGHVTVYDGVRRRMGAAPVQEADAPVSDSLPLVLDDPDGSEVASSGLARLGLGIDAGGTFTDAVLYDFQTHAILAKAKSLTTKWDFALGIEAAIDGLDSDRLGDVDLVSVSTTLATNAIVEEQGQRVALLLMTPCGWTQPKNFTHDLLATISGQLEINGRELEPVDPEQVRRTVRDMIDRQGAEAFAVAGYASHINPAHELQVMAAAREETDATITCAHDISAGPNYRLRAETAVLNAKIIPALDAFLEKVQSTVLRRGLRTPIMVVKSDGSLMSLSMARSRPVETILSGPAASVAGASYLTGAPDALIVDIGGTTTDTATIRHGVVQTCADGATVGRWKTLVEALDMRTLGLGGDSRILCRGGQIEIGPQRIAPVAWLAAREPRAGDALHWLEHHPDRFSVSTRTMDLLTLTPYEHRPLTADEARIVEQLKRRPFSVEELIERLGCLGERFMPLVPLETDHIVQRCGFTPTDLLHATGRMNLWDADASGLICDVYARVLRMDRQEMIAQMETRIVRRLALEILKKQMDATPGGDDIESSAAAMDLIGRALGDPADGYSVRIDLHMPVIGIGAPAHCFVPQAAKLLHAEALVPQHADVANAIGAITSPVRIHRRATIAVDENGIYRVEGAAGTPAFAQVEDAQNWAVEHLCDVVRALGRQAGTAQSKVEVTVRDQTAPLKDGDQLFLGRVIEARLTGRPDLARFVQQ